MANIHWAHLSMYRVRITEEIIRLPLRNHKTAIAVMQLFMKNLKTPLASSWQTHARKRLTAMDGYTDYAYDFYRQLHI